MPTSFADIFDTDLTPAEKARLLKIANSVERRSGLAGVAALATDPGLNRLSGVLEQGARDDRVQAAQRFRDEREDTLALSAAQAKATKDEEDRRFRKQQQDDLQEYRRATLGNAAAARAGTGRMTDYQRAQLELQGRKLEAAGSAKQTADAARQRATLAQRYAASGVPQLVASANVANTQLGQYKEGNIPGIGPIENMLPGFAMGEEAQLTKSRVAGLANQLLKLRSGAAVTNPEMARFLSELATGKGVKEEVFRQRWPEVLQLIEAEQSAIMGGYPGIADQYLQESGLPRFKASSPFEAGGTAPGAQPQQGRNRGSY